MIHLKNILSYNISECSDDMWLVKNDSTCLLNIKNQSDSGSAVGLLKGAIVAELSDSDTGNDSSLKRLFSKLSLLQAQKHNSDAPTKM